ncbi:MAG: hypothetical protein K2X91_12565 [Thermoleophilia bacterium]|nr:hypothetical protein [Thermoleophilia bacterium]
MPLKLKCCICKQTLEPKPPAAHSLDPCALELIAHADRDWAGQKSQSFWCHFECFRLLIGDDRLLAIAEPDYETHGEDEAASSNA